MTDPAERRRAIRDGYDTIAAGYDRQRTSDPPEIALLERFADRLEPGVCVLDAGCGGGEPVGTLLAERFDLVGLDFSRAQLDLARDRLPESALVSGDLVSLPFADGSFDAICAAYAVIHVPREQHRDCFEEFRRVLRPGGLLLVTVGTADWTGTNDDWMGFGAAMHWSSPGPERTSELLSVVGFDVLWERHVGDGVSERDGEHVFVLARA